MNDQPQNPASRPAPDPDRYMPGDPIPVPEATEANSESAWALFSDPDQGPQTDFQDTVPASPLEEQKVAIPPAPKA